MVLSSSLSLPAGTDFVKFDKWDAIMSSCPSFRIKTIMFFPYLEKKKKLEL